MLREGKSSFDCGCVCTWVRMYVRFPGLSNLNRNHSNKRWRTNAAISCQSSMHDPPWLAFSFLFSSWCCWFPKVAPMRPKGNYLGELTFGFWRQRGKGGKISPCQFLAALGEGPVGQMTDSRLINASSACRQSKLIGAEVRQLMQLEALIGIGQRQRLGAALHHFFLRNLFVWFGFAAIATMYQYHCITWRISAGFPFV